MKVSIVSTSYNNAAGTRKLVETGMLDADKHDIDFYIFNHQKFPDVIDTVYDLKDNYPIKLYDYGVNRGLSKSWNEGQYYAFQNGADVIIIANDDIYFTPGDVDKLVTKAYNNRDRYIISCAGPHIGDGKRRNTHGYSCFALNLISLEKVGMFDENIFPIYLEDIDHHRRATLLGLVEENCPDTEVVHGGSTAINSDPLLGVQNAYTHKLNIQYFKRKWKTEHIDTGYRYPFNNPDFGLKIEWEDRAHPYGPGYDRDDYEEMIAKGMR